MKTLFILLILTLFQLSHAGAQDARPDSDQPRRNRPRGGFGDPVELDLDDKQTHADPPESIVEKREDIPVGKLEMVETSLKLLARLAK